MKFDKKQNNFFFTKMKSIIEAMLCLIREYEVQYLRFLKEPKILNNKSIQCDPLLQDLEKQKALSQSLKDEIAILEAKLQEKESLISELKKMKLEPESASGSSTLLSVSCNPQRELLDKGDDHMIKADLKFSSEGVLLSDFFCQKSFHLENIPKTLLPYIAVFDSNGVSASDVKFFGNYKQARHSKDKVDATLYMKSPTLYLINRKLSFQ